MKIRNGFVSNSSSSSFVLDKNKISKFQVKQIENYKEVAKELNITDETYSGMDDWHVKVKKNTVELHTWMDNFDMKYFLSQIGVSDDAILDHWCS